MFVVVGSDIFGVLVVNIVGIFMVFEEVVSVFIMDVVVVVGVVFVVVMVESVVVVLVASVLAAATVVAVIVVIWDMVVVGAVDTVVEDVVVTVVVVVDLGILLMVVVFDGLDSEPFLTVKAFSTKLDLVVGAVVVVERVTEYVGISSGVVVCTEAVIDCDVSLAFEMIELFFVLFNVVSTSSLLNDVGGAEDGVDAILPPNFVVLGVWVVEGEDIE